MNDGRRDNAAEARRESTHAEGTLGATPLAHLLVFAHQRSLTGKLTIEHARESVEVTFVRGLVRSAHTTTAVAYLGNVLYELGFIDGQGLSDTLAELAARRSSRPPGAAPARHGELLVERGLIGEKELARGLRDQLERKLVHAFSFTDGASFVFRPESEREEGPVTDPSPGTDPYALAWAGLRTHGTESRARSILARLGNGKLKLTPNVDLERYAFNLDERRAAARFAEAAAIGNTRIEMLVAYVLAITKALGPAPAAVSEPSVHHASQAAPIPEPKRFTTPPIGSVRVPSANAVSSVRSHKAVSDPKVNFENAQIALAQHDLELAEALCRKAHEEEPRHAEYIALLAWLRTFHADGATPKAIAEALEMLELALDLHPGCEHAYMYRAQIRKGSGDAEGSISDFRSAHTLNPNNVEAARELRIHDMRVKNSAAHERRSSGLFQRILGKK